MTTFEEDLNRRMDLKEVPMYFTQSGCSMTRKTYIETNWVFDTYKNWHSDEEFQKMLELGGSYVIANKHLVDDNKRLTQEIADLKSQLQQQALPVVPECVGEFITKVKKAGNNLTFVFNSKFDECPAKYWNEAIVWRLNHPEEFAIAFITGNYEVEKQMFYLRNKLTGLYLYKKPLGGYGEDPAHYIKDLTNDFKFTQKEIDGMDVQSYDKKDEYKGE